MLFAVTPWSAGLEAPTTPGDTRAVPTKVTTSAPMARIVRAPLLPRFEVRCLPVGPFPDGASLARPWYQFMVTPESVIEWY